MMFVLFGPLLRIRRWHTPRKVLGLVTGWCCLVAAGGAAPLSEAEWRAEWAAVRQLRENDAPAAHARAMRLEAGLVADAPAVHRILILNLLAGIERHLALAEAAERHATAARELARRHADPKGEAEAEMNLARLREVGGQAEAALAAANRSVALLADQDDVELWGLALACKADVHDRLGQNDEALAARTRAMERVRGTGDRTLLVRAHCGLGLSLAQGRHYEEAREHFRQARELARRESSRRLECEALLLLGATTGRLTGAHEAAPLFQEALALARRLGAPHTLALCCYNLGDNLLQQSRPREARPLLDEAAAIYRAHPYENGLRNTLNVRSQIHRALGEAAAALRDAEESYGLARKIGLARYVSDAARRLAEHVRDAGDLARAYELARESREMAERAGREAVDLRVAELAKRYETERRQRELDELGARNRQQAAELELQATRARLLWLSLGGSGAVAAAIALLLWRERNARQRAVALNRQLLATQEALAAANRLQGAILDNEHLGVIATSPEGPITVFNSAAEKMLGCSRTDVVGQRWGMDFVDPQEIATRAIELSAELGRPVAAGRDVFISKPNLGQVEEREWTFIHRTGRCVPVKLRITAIRDDAGRVTGYVGTVEDLTASKLAAAALALDEQQRRAAEAELSESHRRYTSLVNTVDGIVWEADAATFAFTFVSQQAERLLGYPVQAWLTEPGFWASHVHPEDRDWAVDYCMRATRERRNHDFSYRMSAADGHIVWLHDVVTVVIEPDQSVKLRGIMVDVTELKCAEAALRASEARFRQAFECTATGMAILDRNGRWTRVNRALRDMLGYPEEVLGRMTCWDIVHGADAGPVREAWAEMRAGRRPFVQVEVRCRHSLGHGVWVRLIVAAVRSDGGELLHEVAQIEDIGARKRLEAELRLSDQRFWQSFEHSPLGMGIVSLSGRALKPNQALCQMTGHARGWARKRPFEQLLHAEERAAVVALIRRFRESDQSVCVRETRLNNADGGVTWVLLTAMLVRDGAGRPRHVLIQMENISARKRLETELRESEERFRLAFEEAGIGMALVDMAGRWLRTNRALGAILGYSGEELRRTTFQELTHPDDLAGNQPVLRRLLAGESPSMQVEKRYRHRDGHYIWGRLTAVIVRSATGEPLHYVSQIEEITQRKQMEAELRAARDEAIEAARAKSEFLASMSHEIRTPMNAILGMAELLDGTALDEKQREMTRLIRNGGGALMTIINDILDFSKMEAGKLRIEPVDFELHDLIEDTVALLAVEAQRKGLALRCALEPALTAGLAGDATRIRQVLTNLLGNAIKFTAHGGVEVAGRVTSDEPGHLGFRVSVRDTGIGIAAGARAQLFRPFMQLEGGASRRFGGTGLGLAISQRLIAAMGGTLDFQSEEGAGSTFWFELTLPRCLPPAPAARPPEKPLATVARELTPVQRGRGLRLLVVDDNDVNRLVAHHMLEHLGHRVELAVDGQAALERLAAQRFDAVFMDCQMPGLDGYEATRRIRSGALPGVDARVPIVALTAYALPGDRERCLAAGMDDYLAKPFRPDDLAQCFVRCGFASGRAAPASPGSVWTDLPVLDRDHLARIAHLNGPDGAPLIKTLLSVFVAETSEHLPRVNRLLAARESEALATVAHTLAGSAASVGAADFRAIASELEQAVRAGRWDAARPLGDALEASWVELQHRTVEFFS